MCLATVYKNPENTVVCKNVSRIDVDGEYVLIRDILGEEIRLQGKISYSIKAVLGPRALQIGTNRTSEPGLRIGIYYIKAEVN